MSARDAHEAGFWSGAERGALTIVVLGCLAALVSRTSSWRSEPPLNPPPRIAIDPNTAPASVLLTLPRIGPSRARAIIAERERSPFASAEDLAARVSGIGPTTLNGMRRYLHFPAPSNSVPTPTELPLASSGEARPKQLPSGF